MEKGNKESKKWAQEEVSNEINNRELAEEESVDWRGRPSNPSKHGGMRAALFVLGIISLIPSPFSLSLSLSLSYLTDTSLALKVYSQ